MINFRSTFLVVACVQGLFAGPSKAFAEETLSAPVAMPQPLAEPKEIVVDVRRKKNLARATTGGSQTQISKDRIETLPGGTSSSLPALIAATSPGVVAGPFGQLFIRGNHANIQYQIDGVQLPESSSGSFGEAFSPRNIDHMDFITGGLAAEYGERLAAVVNIVTRSGPETPEGSAEVRYGSYNTINPQARYGGSDSSGRFRYLISASYLQTDRGLDVPDPASYANQNQGDEATTHDLATADDEFVRLDYQASDVDKFTLNLFNSSRKYQIPNYPTWTRPADPYFQPGYQDQFGNVPQAAGQPLFNWTPANTDDTQGEHTTYAEFIWKRTLSDVSALQIAPYYKRSTVSVGADPQNDLATLIAGPNFIATSQADSFTLYHPVDNYGLKSDYTLRLGENHSLKAGLQAQESKGNGSFTLQTNPTGSPTAYGIADVGWIESIYLQDTYAIAKALTLNAGLRYSASQFNSDQISAQDGLLQPRIGLEYMPLEFLKLHVFYGKLFQPAPFENLSEAFNQQGGGTATPYDLKAEKDDYYEAGIAQQLGKDHLVTLTGYYKDATNMLDDQQLLNTSLAQPYNFANGYAKGIELSYSAEIAGRYRPFLNYSYEEARGRGVSGGTFANPSNSTDYVYLDHVQLDTLNGGLTYQTPKWWATATGLYGSGLRTGLNNSSSLPPHYTMDLSVGYLFPGEEWFSQWRISGDLTNVFDDPYPITVANGFNGSHYSAGRQWFLRLAKTL